MQTVIQYKQIHTSNQSSTTGFEETKIVPSPSRISSEDLMGLSWVFLDDDFTSQFKEGC